MAISWSNEMESSIMFRSSRYQYIVYELESNIFTSVSIDDTSLYGIEYLNYMYTIYLHASTIYLYRCL